MNDLISIIVPIYNCEQYLEECLESIISQSYSYLEIILIDDGSVDSSGSICDRYEKKDSRIKVIHKANGGVSSARNVGINQAKGDWLFFFDADDILPTNLLMEMMNNSESVDFVCGGIKEIDVNGKENGKEILLPQIDITVPDMLYALFHEEQYGYLGTVAPKLFKVNIIRDKNLFFNEKIKYNEDRLFITQYLINCSSAKLSKQQYLYRQHENSALGKMKKNFNVNALTELYAFEEIKKLLRPTFYEIYLYVCRLTFEKALYFYNIGFINDVDVKKDICKIINNNAKVCFFYYHKSVIDRIKLLLHVVLKK